MTNCPNCGAPIVSAQCEYCGTVFPDYVSSSMYKMQSLKAERLNLELDLLKAKTKVLQDAASVRTLYEDAIRAMRAYSG